jgi:hypothetical protein
MSTEVEVVLIGAQDLADRNLPGGACATHEAHSTVQSLSKDLSASDPLQTNDRMRKYLVDVGIRQRTCSHLQPVIDGSVEKVDHHVGVDIFSEKTVPYTLFEEFDRHSTARHRPSLTESVRKFWVKLRLGKQSTDETAVFAAKRLRHRSHLQANRFKISTRRQEEGVGVNPRDESVHDHRRLIGPPTINTHPTNSGFSSDRIHTERSKALREDEMDRSVQDRLMYQGTPGAPDRGRLRFGLFPLLLQFGTG